MAQGGFHDLPERHRFMVQGAARRHLAGLRVRLKPHDPVLLNHAYRDAAQAVLAEKGQEVVCNPGLVVLQVAGIPLAIGQGDIFRHEMLGGIGKGALLLQLARAALAPKLQIPVLGKLLGLGETVGFAADPPLLAVQIG